MKTECIKTHVQHLNRCAREDIAAGKWDEVMTDALYAACRATTPQEMADARAIAEAAASHNKMSPTYTITGNDAIRLAERDQLTIQCHSNPIDDGGPVTPNIARQIAKEDPSLIYVQVVPTGWWVSDAPLGYHVGDYFAPDGMYLGPDCDGVEPRWNDAQ